jgi:hypothetical protein
MSARSRSALQHCRLCGDLAILRRSHIVPRAWYRRMLRISPRGIVRVQGRTAVLSPRQDAEYMLCSECEARFSTREDYFSRVALQPNGLFPAYDAIVPIPGSQLEGHGSAGDASTLNCSDLCKRCLASQQRALVVPTAAARLAHRWA